VLYPILFLEGSLRGNDISGLLPTQKDNCLTNAVINQLITKIESGDDNMNKTKVAKAFLYSVLAGTMVIGAAGTAGASSDGAPAKTNTAVHTDAIAEAKAHAEAAAPSLLPGDFLYFVKTVVEKIELALTFNDTKQAQLLVAIAQERIHEANALMAEGKAELAAATLKEALVSQEAAVTYTEKMEGTEQTAAKAELSAKVISNVQALVQAMEQVDNPKAKEALAKNVEKSLVRLEKAIEKQVRTKEKTEAKAQAKPEKSQAKAERKSKEDAFIEIGIAGEGGSKLTTKVKAGLHDNGKGDAKEKDNEHRAKGEGKS
jgi:hypothetical protein